jgi:hypothetical protein
LFAPFAPLLRTEQQALFDMSPDYAFDDFSFDYSTTELAVCRADFSSSWSPLVGIAAPAPCLSSGSDDSSRSNSGEQETVTTTNLGTTADSCC